MPRVKPQLKRIADKTARQATFSTRREGLFKKAKELAIMCDAEVGVVVISETKKIWDLAHAAHPKDIIETIETWKTLGQDKNQALKILPLDLNPKEEEDKRLFDEYHLKIREGLGNFSMEQLQLFKELLQKMDILLKEKEREEEVSEEKIVELQNTIHPKEEKGQQKELGVENVVHQEWALSNSVLTPNANHEDTLDLILSVIFGSTACVYREGYSYLRNPTPQSCCQNSIEAPSPGFDVKVVTSDNYTKSNSGLIYRAIDFGTGDCPKDS